MDEVKVSFETAKLVRLLKQLHDVETEIEIMYDSDSEVQKTAEAFLVAENRVFELLTRHNQEKLTESCYTYI